jgi:medium-chain acyl-CoA synthetase
MAHYENKSISRPASFNFAKDVVDYWAARNLQAMLWVSQDGRERRNLDFKHFSQQSSRIARLLTQLGISRGDVLLIIAPRLPQW